MVKKALNTLGIWENLSFSRLCVWVFFFFSSFYGFSWWPWWWSQFLCDELEEGEWVLWNTTYHELEVRTSLFKSEQTFRRLQEQSLWQWCCMISRGSLAKIIQHLPLGLWTLILGGSQVLPRPPVDSTCSWSRGNTQRAQPLDVWVFPSDMWVKKPLRWPKPWTPSYCSWMKGLEPELPCWAQSVSRWNKIKDCSCFRQLILSGLLYCNRQPEQPGS